MVLAISTLNTTVIDQRKNYFNHGQQNANDPTNKIVDVAMANERIVFVVDNKYSNRIYAKPTNHKATSTTDTVEDRTYEMVT